MSKKGFDKNSILGLVLIGAILLVFSYLTKPTEEEIAAKEKQEQLEKTKTEPVKKNSSNTDTTTNTLAASENVNQATIPDALADSLNNLGLAAEYGPFTNATQGDEKEYTIENELIKVTFSSLGGRVATVELKEFHTYDTLPLHLFHKDSSQFNLELTLPGTTGGNSYRSVNTQNLFFETTDTEFTVEGENQKSISFKLYDNTKQQYLEYKYTLKGNSYTVDFDINTVGFDDVLMAEYPLYLKWNIYTPTQEKTIKNQQQKSTIYYKYHEGDVDYLNEMKYEEEEMEGDIDWIMFKQQYFNAALITKEKPFERADSKIETIEIKLEEATNYVQGMSAELTIPYQGNKTETFAMQYYFGPNKYEDLNDMNIELEKSLDYGWLIFGWVNTFIIRPIFNFLNGFGIPIGIVILLLTVIIKMILFPITWKTYVSSAKMRVLKPEITALTEKFKNDSVKKQQATMALYRQTGVNPLAGCIPMLIQMPILFALFRFFPATFDLRQKSFLWAEDLSTYDSIYQLPFDIPFYGDHISLFTLLMAISMIFYTKANSQMTAGAGMEGAMASQMKIMTYMMPVMMLFFFNSYAAGLSLYYLIANVITIGQQYAIRKWIVDEDKILAKLEANKKKPKKKTGFAAKLEQRMKDAQATQKKSKK